MGLRKILINAIRAVNPLRNFRVLRLQKARRTNQPFIGRMPGTNMKMVIRPKMYFADIYADTHIFEPGTINFMQKNVKAGMTVLDIGANVGYFTLLLAKLVGPSGRVLAFEPSTFANDLLQQNVEINRLKNVSIYKLAVSNSPGELNIFEGPEGFEVYNSTAEIIHPSARNIQFVRNTVRAITIDDFIEMNGINGVDFVKIDVEGAEYNVLKGMRKTIETNEKIKILFEFADIIDDKNNFMDMISYFRELGMVCGGLDHRGQIIDLDQMYAVNTHMFLAEKKVIV